MSKKSLSPPPAPGGIVAPPVMDLPNRQEGQLSQDDVVQPTRYRSHLIVGSVCFLMGLAIGRPGIQRSQENDIASLSEVASSAQTVLYKETTHQPQTVVASTHRHKRPAPMPQPKPTKQSLASADRDSYDYQPDSASMMKSIAAAAVLNETDWDPVEESELESLKPEPAEAPQAAIVSSAPAIPQVTAPVAFQKQWLPTTVQLPVDTKRVTLLDDDDSNTCQMKTLQTTVQWAPSPAEAYRLAKEQDKLVFLIHVSGNFEIPEFT